MAIGDTSGPNYTNIARQNELDKQKSQYAKPKRNLFGTTKKTTKKTTQDPVGTNTPEAARVTQAMGKPVVVEETPSKNGYVRSTVYSVGMAPVNGTRYIMRTIM